MYYIQAIVPPIGKFFIALLLVWVFSLNFVWTLGYTSRAKGDGAAFKKYVTYFLRMYGVNFIIGMIFTAITLSYGS